MTAYVPDPESVDLLASATGRYRILTVLATWCSDSDREIPRLHKVLEEVGGNHFSHVMIGVDRTRRVGDPEVVTDLGGNPVVDRVPTVVVIDEEGLEIGRFVESADQPIESVLADLVATAEGWS